MQTKERYFMPVPHVNYLAVLVSGVAIFVLGGLWYSPALFAKPWVRLMNKTEEELKANAPGALPYIVVFICALLTAFALAVILNHFQPLTILRGTLVAILCWVGFAGSTSYGSAVFSGTPGGLWRINSFYNLVSFIVAAIILTLWR
jgi:hypothetical protein